MAKQETADIPETEEEWRERLSDDAYRVLREQGTEAPFTGDYVHVDDDGVFRCAGCGTELFSTVEKYDSGCGWPSFWAPTDADSVETRSDHSHGMERTEVVCAACGGHLGHVFEDGPEPTGQRYCINSVALQFEPEN